MDHPYLVYILAVLDLLCVSDRGLDLLLEGIADFIPVFREALLGAENERLHVVAGLQ